MTGLSFQYQVRPAICSLPSRAAKDCGLSITCAIWLSTTMAANIFSSR
ncbi:Uncharacterised protein [Vibrio cholerae]|nr:Uncharacterised protein [Vibrio cholerae]